MTHETKSNDDLKDAQIRALYDHFPGIIFAPTAGGLFTAWVLWGHVNNRVLSVLILLAIALSAVRFVAYLQYQQLPDDERLAPVWTRFALITSLISGAIWGSFGLFIYPTVEQSYEVYITILLSLVPVAPVAALATYLPCFYAYYIPSAAPFLFVLASQGTRSGWTSAILAAILMIATLQFARQFYKSLTEAQVLRIDARAGSVRLAQSLKDRNQFMVDANHDLRQPLQALDLSLGSENEPDFTPSQRQLQIGRMAVSTLNEYLERLREVTRYETHDAPVDIESFPVNPEMVRLFTLFEPTARNKGIEMRHVFSSVAVSADKSAFNVILRNLLENAITHTEAGSKVLLGCKRRQGAIEIVVLDNGPGIAPEDQKRIFGDFVQLNNPVRDKNKGIGLGLSIARRAADLMGFEIRLEASLGKGARFSFSLPLAEIDPLRPIHSAPKQSPDFPENAKILILEGEAAIREGLTSVLNSWGLDACGCQTSAEAVSIIRGGFEPDAIVVDYRLEPLRNGFEAWAELTRVSVRELPCLVITGDTDPEIERRAEALGCFFFLKPINLEAFSEGLQTALPSDELSLPFGS